MASLRVWVKRETLPEEVVSMYQNRIERGDPGDVLGKEVRIDLYERGVWWLGQESNGGEFYLNWRSWDVFNDAPDIPAEVSITRYSFEGDFYCLSDRLCGTYKHGDAMARLDRRICRSDNIYDIHLESVCYYDMQELFRLIRTGQILPVENWDAPSIKPKVDLSTRASSFWARLFRLNG